MINFLKKYKALFIGLIVIPIFYLLEALGIIIVPEDRKLSIIPYLIFWDRQPFFFLVQIKLINVIIHIFKYKV